MDDRMIIDLFFARSEDAIEQTRNKYGKLCRYISKNILGSDEDAEECENDTYLKLWNSIPPNRPEKLSAFIGKIARNLALNRLESKNAQKRGGQTEIALCELEECLTSSGELSPSDGLVLREAINAFLASLTKTARVIFVRRYWYLSPIRDIARDLSLSESNVKVSLMRTRNKFKEYLEKEGINI